VATKRKGRGGITLFKVRDAASIAIGSFMLLYQTITWQINPYLVAAALTLLGFPSVVGAISHARGYNRFIIAFSLSLSAAALIMLFVAGVVHGFR
jgi:hypothetical protein